VNPEPKPRITLSALGLILARLVAPALSLVFMSVIAKVFGSKLVAGYYLPLTWVFVFQSFAALGVGDLVARDVGREPGLAGSYVTHGLFLAAGFSAPAMLAMVGAARLFHYSPEVDLSIRVLSASLLPASILLVCEGLYLARQDTKYMVVVSILETAVSVCVNLILLLNGCGLPTLMVTIVGARIAAAATHLWIIHRRVVPLKLQIDKQRLRSLFVPSLVFGAVKILSLVVVKADVLILSKFRELQEVGLYLAAGKLMEAWLIIPHAFSFAAFPLLAKELCLPGGGSGEILARTGRRLFSVAIPIVAGMILFSRDIVSLLYGPGFLSVSPVLDLMMLSFLLMCGDALLGHAFRASGRQNLDLGILSANAGTNVLLNFLFVPRFGMLGACWATLLSMALSLSARIWHARTTMLRLDLSRIILRPFALVTLPALAVLVFRGEVSPLLLGGTFLGGYSLGWWLTKAT